MRKLVLLCGVAVGLGLLATPALAAPDELVIRTPLEVHTVYQPRVSEPGITTFSCGNAWRDIVCDAVLGLPAESVYVGNQKLGASYSVYEQSQPAPTNDAGAPIVPTSRDAVFVVIAPELHTRGVRRVSAAPDVSLSCGNVPRQIACDNIQGGTPQQVSVGNATHGASVHITSGEGLHPAP